MSGSATIDIDDMYRVLSRCGGRNGRPMMSGTVHRVHVVLHRALTQAVRWEWIWFNPAANSIHLGVTPAEIRPPTPATKPDAGLRSYLRVPSAKSHTNTSRASWATDASRIAGCMVHLLRFGSSRPRLR